MGLTLILVVCSAFVCDVCVASPQESFDSSNETNSYINCPEYGDIDHATVKLIDTANNLGLQALHVECQEGYELIGPPKILCHNGDWEDNVKPRCVDSYCAPPPYVTNGALEIDGERDERLMFKQGTTATYTCGDGYNIVPNTGNNRIVRRCDRGVWTEAFASCVSRHKPTGCSKPNDIANGYFVHEKFGVLDGYGVGQRLHYSCNSGYVLKGASVQQCLDNGTWSPRLQPVCITASSEIAEDWPCSPAPTVPHAVTMVLRRTQSEDSPLIGTEIEIRCAPRFRNSHSICKPARLHCLDGRWLGEMPNCVPVKECYPPPVIPHGAIFELSPAVDSGRGHHFPLGSEISFKCLPGYELQGNYMLTCSEGGCWEPATLPSCSPDEQYYVDLSGGTVLASIGTGAGVLLLLVVICLAVVCRRRKPWSRAAALPPPVPRVDLADHAALLHHPDRLALIAFADGLQNGQSILPSYEEAVRDRGPGLFPCRPPRPHWPALALRRTRAPNVDTVHVTRQGSFASHSASTRSGGDPMGSTDTMAVSENSTTVTLETASSLSGSQPASCRAHCGSLASFDTSSILNTEGVPLLEESELEDTAGLDTVSLALENRSMADNTSFKLRRTSPDLA